MAFPKLKNTVDTFYNQFLIVLFVGEREAVGKEEEKKGKGRQCTCTQKLFLIQGQKKTGSIIGLRSSFFHNKEN